MTSSVNLNKDFVGAAQAAWGGALPAWVLALAEECARTNQTRAAARIRYSGSAVSQIINNKCEKFDLAKIEATVRGALMGETVDCPELQDIPRDQCLWEQQQPLSSASALRAQVYRRCRSGCPHSRIKGADDAVNDLA